MDLAEGKCFSVCVCVFSVFLCLVLLVVAVGRSSSSSSRRRRRSSPVVVVVELTNYQRIVIVEPGGPRRV